MLMILARLVRSESFWAVVKVRSPHNGPEVSYPRRAMPESVVTSAHTTLANLWQPERQRQCAHIKGVGGGDA